MPPVPARRRRRVAGAATVVVALAVAACSSGNGDRSARATTSVVQVGTGADGYGAVIRRTTDGVAHISANDFRGVSFGQGWASNEDHGCTLADQILKVTSTRAKYLGAGERDTNVKSDIAWKALGLADRAQQEFPKQPEDVRDLVAAFTAGWNAHLAEVGAAGMVGWCKGAAWVQPITPEQVYLYARSITLQASGARLTPFLSNAQPPKADAAPAQDQEVALADLAEPPIASNGWAIGSTRTTGGDGMLLANPHFPWEGELRFWEVQLTVPGKVDVYGAQLVGLPGLAVGFNEDVAWTHTVSAGTRFTAYTLALAPGKPTSYLVDGAEVPMTSEDIGIEVLRDDGGREVRNWTVWRTEYGPVLDFPGVGWTADRTIAYRDANIDDDEFLPQYLAMLRATDIDDLKAIHRRYQGVPLFNTIAVGADGSTWYADTSATPNLSADALAAYGERLVDDPLTQLAAGSKAILLDGSTSRDRWEEVEGARDPGLVPWSGMPMTERTDYLFNANDSFWLPNADHPLEGDYSPLQGPQRTARSPRTRENATLLRDTSAGGPAGGDGTFTLGELRDAALWDHGYTARALKDEAVARCRASGPVRVPAMPGAVGSPGLPAATVDLAPACDVLAAWDGTYDVGSRGAALWREFVGRFTVDELWAGTFDPAEPVDTPAGLALPFPDQPDPVPQALARAVQTLGAAGKPLDVPLGELQIDGRVPDARLPVPGGTANDGVTNIVTDGAGSNTSELLPVVPPPIAPRSKLTTAGTYPVSYGTSFLLAVELTPDGPRASSILTYGQTDDRSAPWFTSQVQRFAAKDWKPVRFTDAQIRSDPELTVEKVRG